MSCFFQNLRIFQNKTKKHRTAIYGERIIATFDGCTAAAPTAVYEHPHLQERPMTTVVHADVHQVGHHLVGPYAAAQLYLQENKQHRDELLAAASAEE